LRENGQPLQQQCNGIPSKPSILLATPSRDVAPKHCPQDGISGLATGAIKMFNQNAQLKLLIEALY
jgi:hypothetical protein